MPGQELGSRRKRRQDLAKIVIQRGHVGRKTGATGTAGEQEYVIKLSKCLKRQLGFFNYDVEMIDAKIDKSIKADVFIALHCDGAANEEAHGFCLGYPKDKGDLAAAIKRRYEVGTQLTFRGYNITKNLSEYYAWPLTKNCKGQALVEVGFLTNPEEADWLNKHLEVVAKAIARGVREFLGS
jgi:N-acetylmuramoyl-L-alanine amidase